MPPTPNDRTRHNDAIEILVLALQRTIQEFFATPHDLPDIFITMAALVQLTERYEKEDARYSEETDL